VLGERDCSVQKNHQKLLEESPSLSVTDEMRGSMTAGAIKLFKSLNYRGAGTIEFLVVENEFYFMEVNARVQVEHPVSEAVTGVDIIRNQILACADSGMEIEEGSIKTRGHAIECRINALASGVISKLTVPGGPGIRFDTYIYEGCTIPPWYDSMLGKLIAHDTNRDSAIKRMNRALRELQIEGVKTNIAEQLEIINDPVFKSSAYSTSFYDLFVARQK
jgi:acetyl-CoA carboxylase biotin carboxylase subunit